MDLFKAFDTLNRDLLLAKLHANGFYRDFTYSKFARVYQSLGQLKKQMGK